MSEHQSPEKKSTAPMQSAESAGGQSMTAPAFGLEAGPIQRQTPDDSTANPPALTAPAGADTAQLPPVVVGTQQAAPTTAPATTTTGNVFDQLVAENPATNKDIATWVLKAAGTDIGFVTWDTGDAKVNWENIRDGVKTGSVAKPHEAAVFKALPTVVALIKARVNRYIAAGYKGTKEVLRLGSFMNGRNGTHGNGQAIDINGLDFTTSVEKVLTLLKDLPTTNKYGIGLPSQGEFFDPDYKWATKKVAIEAAGKAAEFTGYLHGSTSNYKMTYVPGQPATDKTPEVKAEWKKEKVAGANALSLYMKSKKIKDQINSMSGSYCYPDNDSHIHVDTL